LRSSRVLAHRPTFSHRFIAGIIALPILGFSSRIIGLHLHLHLPVPIEIILPLIPSLIHVLELLCQTSLVTTIIFKYYLKAFDVKL
jgi:hypothetical protein